MARKAKPVTGHAVRVGLLYLSTAGQWAPLSLRDTQLYETSEDAMQAGRDVLGELLPGADDALQAVAVESRLCVKGL